MPSPIAKVDPNPKRDLSLCKVAWLHLRGHLLSLLLSELKSRGLTPVPTPSLCRDLAAVATTLVAKVTADPGTGLRAEPSVLQVLLKFPSFAITNSTPPEKKKKKSVITEHMQLLNILFNITSACSENYISQFLYTVSVCQILPTRLP